MRLSSQGNGSSSKQDPMTVASQAQKVGVRAESGATTGPSSFHIKADSSKTKTTATPNTPQTEVTPNISGMASGFQSPQRVVATIIIG